MNMEYRRLGNSGLKVSKICLGAMMFGEHTDSATAARIARSAFDAGVNFIDTADTYGEGESERIVGKLISKHRERWVVATKFTNKVDADDPNSGGAGRKWILQAVAGSLGRLGTDYIDVYYFHRDDRDTPLEESLGTMADLIRGGKVRYFGLSNFQGWRIAEVVGKCRQWGLPQPIVLQPCYHALYRIAEVEAFPACRHYGLGIVPYSPLARGVLTGKYLPGARPPADSRAGRKESRFLETEFRDRVAGHRAEARPARREKRHEPGAFRSQLGAEQCAGDVRARRAPHLCAVAGLSRRARAAVRCRGRGAGRQAGAARPLFDAGLYRSQVSGRRQGVALLMLPRG